MAYVHQVSFHIRPDQMGELEVGASLERVLGYLRTLLPNEPGFSSSRALYSLDLPGKTEVVFQSTWETWEDLVEHRRSALAENKVLSEFEPHVTLQELAVRVFEEVA